LFHHLYQSHPIAYAFYEYENLQLKAVMKNQSDTTLSALRDFFLALTGEDLCKACTKLAKNGAPEFFSDSVAEVDWDTVEFVFNKLFVGPGRLQAPPYASCYIDPEPQLMGSSTLYVQRLYEMAGLSSPLQGHLPCDHLGVELDAAAGLLTMIGHSKADEPRALWRYFLDYHLKIWLPSFLDRARQADDGHPAIDLVLNRLEWWLDEQGKKEEGIDQ
jgi:putative dimethyl sulfoxide reductase chaperone